MSYGFTVRVCVISSRPIRNHCLHSADCHETHKCTTALGPCGDLLRRILPRSDKRNGEPSWSPSHLLERLVHTVPGDLLMIIFQQPWAVIQQNDTARSSLIEKKAFKSACTWYKYVLMHTSINLRGCWIYFMCAKSVPLVQTKVVIRV
jgi:hypothetical protein